MTPDRPPVLMIAGFGDNASMYVPLTATALAHDYALTPHNFPGFGAPLDGPVSLQSFADSLNAKARATGATAVIAHSVASITASIAASAADSPITQILSLEGNLTAEDAYFSGKAKDYSDGEVFKAAFLAELERPARDIPVIDRYRRQVMRADADALLALGQDAYAFSDAQHPGDYLQHSADVTYIFNPDNCPDISMAWLAQSGMRSVHLAGASHWPTLDHPTGLARAVADILAKPS